MNFPHTINEYIKDKPYIVNDDGRSGDTVYIFEDKLILKTSTNIDGLKREFEKIKWLSQYNLTAKPLCFIIENKIAYFLREQIKGSNLINKEHLADPYKLIDYIVEAVSLLRKLDSVPCPFKSEDNIGNDFIHGDLCLPNIIVNNNKVSGFIDLENSGKGDKWYDYSWLIWSFEYNLKTNKYTSLLLNKLGISFNKEKYNQYIPK